MPHLYLLRHGEAQSDGPDNARALTQRGAANVERLAAWAARAGLKVSEIRHSPKTRARQTAEIFARHLKCEAIEIDGITPNDDAAAFVRSLDGDGVMYVSHLPFLSYAVSALAGTPRPVVDFHPATLVGLVRVDEHYLVDFVIHPAVV
jgi:phosphohistidine phosphatase